MLERLGPLDAVVEPLQAPMFLQEVQDRTVRVGRVLGVHGALVVDERVGLDVRGYEEGGDAGFVSLPGLVLGLYGTR